MGGTVHQHDVSDLSRRLWFADERTKLRHYWYFSIINYPVASSTNDDAALPPALRHFVGRFELDVDESALHRKADPCDLDGASTECSQQGRGGRQVRTVADDVGNWHVSSGSEMQR